MRIVFTDNSQIDIEPRPCPVNEVWQSMVKHLQHVDIPFRDWDYSNWHGHRRLESLIDLLINSARQIGISVDRDACMNRYQDYFNDLHALYESGYDGDQRWLDFHELIHLCERFGEKNRPPQIRIDYRELAGMITRPFDPSWITHGVTHTEPGDIDIRWAELGKTPYDYWHEGEPDDATRLCALAKPWLSLRPAIVISIESADRMLGKDAAGFEKWWDARQGQWCRHWGIQSWSLQDMYRVMVFGRVRDPDRIRLLADQGVYPRKILA